MSTAYASGPDSRLRPFEALRAIGRLIADPEDTRQVFVVLAAMRGKSGRRMFERFAGGPVGAAVLADRRRLIDVLEDQAGLARLPEASLGRAYLAFMQEANLTAAGLIEPSMTEDLAALGPDGRLFRERMRDMHDLTHVVSGYGRDPLGELCLLAFMFRHSRNLGQALIVLMAMKRFPPGAPGRAARRAIFEGFRRGGRSAWLPGQDWEALLARPLEDIRRELNIAAPVRYQAARAIAESGSGGQGLTPEGQAS
jgi:ubiquinone biosynthesis protein COQ4